MLHGNPTWSFYFRNLVECLRPHARLIVPDHLGCGLSDVPRDADYDYQLHSRVEDIASLIEHLQIHMPITLIAHDWGGMIGMAYACRYPERFRRFVMLNTAAFLLPKGKTVPWQLRLARTPGLGELLVRGLNLFVRGTLRMGCTTRRLPHDIKQAYLYPYRSWKRRRAVLRFVQDIPLTPEHPSYPLVQSTQDRLHLLRHLPMMLGWGMRDFVFDHVFLAEWQKYFPEAQVHIFPEAGHWVLEDIPDKLLPLIKDFVTSQP